MAQSDPIVPPQVKKNYGEKLTLDLDSSLPSTKPEGCLSLKNVIRRHNRGISKRPGVSMFATPSTGVPPEIYVGLHRYTYSNSSFGTTEQLLNIGGGQFGNVYTVADDYLSVTYSGAGTGTISILPNANGVWEVTLKVNGAAIVNWPKTYGDGITSSSKTVNDLSTDIDAEAAWASTPVTTGTNLYLHSKVAQFGCIVDKVITTNTHVSFANTTNISAQTFASVAYAQNVGVDTDYSNLRGVNAQNCMYFPKGKKMPIMKYDGARAYKPGLPRAVLTGVTDAGAGATHAAGNVYIYRIAYSKTDARGNIIVSPYSDDTLAAATHTVGGAPTDINVTYAPLHLGSTSPTDSILFAPASQKVNGNQVGVSSINVTHGSSDLVAGEYVYFKNQASGAYVQRKLLTATGSVITFDPAEGVVNVNNNDVISNTRVIIQRTENLGIDFFEVATIPNDHSSTPQTFRDSVADTALGASVEDQLKLPEPAPNASFVCIHQGLVVYAGLQDDPNGITWNDPNWGLEAYPAASNRDQIVGNSSGSITGIISESDTALAVFKKNGYFRIEGDLASGQYTINEVVSSGLGVASNSSIVKTDLGIFAISDKGPVLIKDGNITIDFADGVLDYFEDNEYYLNPGDTISSSQQTKLVPSRSTGVYWSDPQVILFFIPAETGTYNTVSSTSSIKRYANANSLWLCFDLRKMEWREWDFAEFNINAHLAMVEFQGSIYFLSTNQCDVAPTYSASNYCWRFKDGSSYLDYADNVNAIEWAPRLQWESLGLPSSEKKMTEAKLYARHSRDFISSFGLTLNEYRNNDETTKYTQAARTFSASSDKEKIIEPIPGDFISNAVELYNNTIFECPVLSGIELVYKITSSPEMKDIKGDV